MAVITKPKTWADNENVTYTDLNSTFDAVFNEFNGSISNANIASSAAIVESKLSFNTSTGHDHDGVNSKAIAKGYVWIVTGSLVTSSDAGPWVYVNTNQTVSKAVAVVKTAPTGSSIIVDIEYSADSGVTWTSLWNTSTTNRPTIAVSAKTGTTTSFDTASLTAGYLLRPAVDQVGSTVAGANLTIQLMA
jgi:hypothetical protein